MSNATVKHLSGDVYIRREGEVSFEKLTLGANIAPGDTVIVVTGEVLLDRPGLASPLLLETGADWQATSVLSPERSSKQLQVAIEADINGDQQIGKISSKTFVLNVALPPTSSDAFDDADHLVVTRHGDSSPLVIEITDQMRADGVVAVPYTFAQPGPSYGTNYQFEVLLKSDADETLLAGQAKMTLYEGSEPEVPSVEVAISEDANNDGILDSDELQGVSQITSQIQLDNRAEAGDILWVRVNDGQWQQLKVLESADITAAKVQLTSDLPEHGESLKVEARIETADGGLGPVGEDSARVNSRELPDAPSIVISEDSNNNQVLNFAELGKQKTVATQIILGDNNQAGDKLFVWQNGSKALRGWKLVKSLTQVDIDKGTVDFDVVRLSEGSTLVVKARIITADGERSEISQADKALIDTIGPKVKISSTSIEVSDQPELITFKFNETPKGFSLADVKVSGGKLTGFTKVNSKKWTAKFTADGSDTTPDISIANNRFTDKHGNKGKGHSLELTLKPEVPETPSIKIVEDSNNNAVINHAELGNQSTVSTRITLDADTVVGQILHVEVNGVWKKVKKLTQADIDKSFVDYEVANPGEGTTLKVRAKLVSEKGVSSEISDADSALIDTQGPVLTISGAPDYIAPGEKISLTFTFDDAPKGFEASDIETSQGSISNFKQVSDKEWTADFISSATSVTSPKHLIKVAGSTFTDKHDNSGTGDSVEPGLNEMGVEFDDQGLQKIGWTELTDESSGSAYISFYVTGVYHELKIPSFELVDSQDKIIGVEISGIADFEFDLTHWIPATTGNHLMDSVLPTTSGGGFDATSLYSDKGVQLKDIQLKIDYDSSLEFADKYFLMQSHYPSNSYKNQFETMTIKVTTEDAQTGVVKTQSKDFKLGHEVNDWVYISPLVLDLDNDGVETLAVATDGVDFDIDADGQLDKTGWVGKDDGLLVRDINGDGVINDASELFGEQTVMSDGSEAAEGFSALSDLDSNQDGVFDARDQTFEEVKIWQDSNSDGISQAHELYSLLDMGVASINLKAEQIVENNNGNIAGLRSSWTDTEGNSHTVDDIWFAYQTGAGEPSALDVVDLLTSDEAIPGLVDQVSGTSTSTAVEESETEVISCYATEVQADQLLVEQPQLDH